MKWMNLISEMKDKQREENGITFQFYAPRAHTHKIFHFMYLWNKSKLEIRLICISHEKERVVMCFCLKNKWFFVLKTHIDELNTIQVLWNTNKSNQTTIAECKQNERPQIKTGTKVEPSFSQNVSHNNETIYFKIWNYRSFSSV